MRESWSWLCCDYSPLNSLPSKNIWSCHISVATHQFDLWQHSPHSLISRMLSSGGIRYISCSIMNNLLFLQILSCVLICLSVWSLIAKYLVNFIQLAGFSKSTGDVTSYFASFTSYGLPVKRENVSPWVPSAFLDSPSTWNIFDNPY